MGDTRPTRKLIVLSAGFEEGGVENSVVRLRPYYEDLGYTLKIVTSDLEPSLPHFSDEEFRSIRPDGLSKYAYRLFNPDAYRTIRNVCSSFEPDVVSFHTMHQVTVTGLAAARNIPTIVTAHGPEAYLPSLLPWYLPADDYRGRSYARDDLTAAGRLRLTYLRRLAAPSFRPALRRAGRLVALSRYMQNVFRTDGFEATYVPNLVDPLSAAPLPSAPRILCAGRLERFKGFHLAVAAMPAILAAVPDAHLTIAGEGVERNALEKLVAELGLGHAVTLTGRLSRPSLEAAIAASKVFVMPSIWPEAFGKAGVEAMSVGRPVVAADVGGISEWLEDGRCGYLVQPGSTDEIAQAVIRLLHDEALCARMGEQARRGALRWDARRHVAAIHLIDQDLIRARRGGRLQSQPGPRA